MATKPIVIKILGDSKGFEDAADKTEKKLSGMAGKFAKYGAAAGVALAGVGIAAGAALFKVGGDFDEQFDKIRVGTGATGDALEGLEGSFKNVLKSVPTDFDGAGSAIADLNTRLGLTGKPLENLSGQFINLSRISKTDLSGNIDNITRVFGDWGVAVDDQASSMDKLYRASQASGIGIDELSTSVVTFGAPLRNLGFGFDESIALLAQFNKTGVNTETAFAGLKAGVGKLAKAGEDVPATFKRVVDEITKMGPGTEATAKAIELFGQRAGPDLADAIAGGKFEIGEMLGAITNGEDTINGAAKDTESFGEKWQLIKNRVLVGLEPLATKVFDGIGKAMDKLGPILEQVFTWLSVKLPPAIEKLQAFVEILVTKFQENWPAIRDAVIPVIDQIWLVIQDFITLATELWARFGDDILAFINKVWPIIGEIIESYLRIIKGIIEVFTGIISGDWGKIWEGIKNIFGGIWDQIIARLNLAWETIKAVVGVGLEILKGLFTAPLAAIQLAVQRAFDDVVSFISGLGGKISDKARGMWDGITDAFKGAINAIVEFWNGLEFKVPGFKVGPIGYDGFTLGLPEVPKMRAYGGPAAGRVRVGERGPEDVILPRGSRVVPNHSSGSDSGISVYVTNPQADPLAVAREVAWAMRVSGR